MKIASHLCRSLSPSVVLLALTPSAFAADFIFSTGVYSPGVTAPEPLLTGQVLQINAGGNKFFSGGSFTNQSGLVNWNANSLFLQNGTVINNQALWDTKADNALVNNGGPISTFNNSGTLRKSAGPGALSIGSIAFTNSGTLDVLTGSLSFGGGNATFNGGTIFSGGGSNLVSNNASFNGAITSSNLTLQNGFYTGTAVVLSGSADFSGGVLAGTWQLGAGQDLNGRAGGNKFLSGATFTNKGNLRWQTVNSLFLQNGSTLDNQQLFDLQQGMSLVNNGGPLSTITNSGTLRVAAGQSSSVGSLAFVNNGGTLEVGAGGSLNFGGANVTFNAGTQFAGLGVNMVTNTAAFNGSITSTSLSLRSGVFTGGSATLNGSAEFSGGVLQNTWTVASGATLTLADGTNKFLSNATLTNQGTVAWPSGNSLFFQNGSNVTNQGTLVWQTDAAMVFNGGATGSFVNTGLVTKTGGLGTSTIGSVGFSNQGVVNVSTGTIRLPDNFTNNGTLKGIGTFATSALVNAGHVAPGSSLGTLTLDGNYTQSAAGFLDAELATSTQSDSFLVNGTAQLDGTLALSCGSGCAVHDGDNFVILNSTGDLGGTFANVTAVNFGSGFQYEVIYDYNADLVRLSVIHAGVFNQPDLTIISSHTGNFTQGKTGSYTIAVTNSGSGPTSGAVTVAETVPSGLTATAMLGTGWTCTQPAGPCTRSDVLAAAGASYPPITLTVNVAASAPSPQINSATVAGGGETNTSNNTANDPTTINLAPAAVPALDPWVRLILVALLLAVALKGLRGPPAPAPRRA